MAGWMRMARSMLVTGLAFAVAGGGLRALIGIAAVLGGEGTWLRQIALSARIGVVSFILGVGFSGLLALTARGRRFAELSLPRIMALGAGAGFLYFCFIATNGIGKWTVATAILNFVILIVIGGGSAAGLLLFARRAQPALGAAEDDGAIALLPTVTPDTPVPTAPLRRGAPTQQSRLP